MKTNLFYSLLLSSALLQGQVKTSKADAYYNNYSYSKVIQQLEGKKDLPTTAERELAESYRMLSDYEKSEQHFAHLVTHEDKSPNDVLAYAQLLKMNGKYSAADEQMEVYARLNKNDKRALNSIRDKEMVKTLLLNNGQFSIKSLACNSAEQDFGPSYYKDKLVYTSSKADIKAAMRTWNGNNLAFLDIYIADIDSTTAEISNSKRLSEVNRKYHEGPVSFDQTGDHMFFTRNNYKKSSADGVTKLELYESVYANGKWGTAIPFPFNNKEYSLGHPALSADGTVVYFASDMPGGFGGTDLYRSERKSDGTWTNPENLGEQINTEGNELFPFIHANDLLFFASDGHLGLGGLDVFVTPMSEHLSPKVINLGKPINSSKDDFSYVMNLNETKGYFASNREGGKGNDDLYSVDVIKPFVFGKRIEGIAKDKQGIRLSGTAVKVYNASSQLLHSITTDENGCFKLDVPADQSLLITANKKEYFGDKRDLQANENTAPIILVLEKDPGFSLYALITDKNTKEPLEGVTIKLTDLQARECVYLTPKSGDFRKTLPDMQLGDDLIYKIEIKKEGFLTKTIEYEHLIDKSGEIKLHEALDLSLGKMELGTDIGTLLNIKPIYFDVNKFNIRNDAANELDKIVKAMNENPAMVIELGSHTDCRSSKAYNLSLSDKRAKASAAYVVSKGISKERIYGKGYGESKLINDCGCEGKIISPCSEVEHQQNRRTEFIIVKFKN